MDKIFWFFVFLFSLVVLLFLSIPIAKILISIPPDKILGALLDKDIVNSVLLTIKVSALATIVTIILGIPLAYLLARGRFCCKSVIESIIDIPTMIPHVAAGIALLMVFGTNGALGKSFKSLGIEFLDTQFGILCAMMFVSAPFFINGAKEGFKKVDVRLENVSRTLGANSFWTFLKITIPNARKDIINGALMMWGRGMGEFGAVIIIAYHPTTAPVMIYDRFTSFGLPYAIPITALMILASIILFALIRILNNILK